MLTFLDLFAGQGGFRIGMERAGHKCVGFCEWDKHARNAYVAAHTATEEQLNELRGMEKITDRQKEIEKEEYLNGEWYSDDIRNVHGWNVPRADVWCFGAPCQDFSTAGARKGLDGDRSNLVREVFRAVSEIEETDRPEWLIYENVKGMLSSNKGWDFACILTEMGELGYDVEYQLFNTKDFGVPQSRERVYTIGHLRKRGKRRILPITGNDCETSTNQVMKLGTGSIFNNPTSYRVYDIKGIAPALLTSSGGGHVPYIKTQDDTYGNIRKLTPKECYRLQDWGDNIYEKAALVNSKSQLYTRAGNGVSANVVYEIAKRLEGY